MEKAIKTAKGTVDYAGKEKVLIDRIVCETESIYKSMGGVPFDTPLFEMKSVLMNKYGEDSKLIYDLADQGGEKCSLRYDLTVPFARYLAMTKTVKMKRYQTGKVFRRDQPALTKGRYREFYQSDFDIVGEYAHMAADAEIVYGASEILKNFSKEIGDKKYVIRINHKGLVDSMMEECRVDGSIAKSIGSAIDKLDKVSWEDVSKEMREKGAEPESVEQIKEVLMIKGPISQIRTFSKSKIFQTEKGKKALNDLERLNELLVVYGADEEVFLDLSLVRGLEYYTGILLEGGYEGIEGTIVAGGRYDGLVNNLFSGSKPSEDQLKDQLKNRSEISEDISKIDITDKKDKKQKDKKLLVDEVKCVGISLGVSRLFSLVDNSDRKTYTDVLVCSVGSNLLEERIRMCTYLRKNKINTEYFMGESSNFTRHSEYADSIGAGILVLIGRKELEQNTCQIIRGDKKNRVKITVNIADTSKKIKEILEKREDRRSTLSNEDLLIGNI